MRNDADQQHWLDAIISLQEAAELRGISIKTLRSEIRRGALKDMQVSKKRRGMTRREALRECRC
jgi:predicted site-specific integrase-resolvase